MAVKFTLVGPHAGQTVLKGRYQFEKGDYVFDGSDDDAKPLVKILRYHAAYTGAELTQMQDEYDANQALRKGPVEPAAIVSESDDKKGDAAEKARLAKEKMEADAALKIKQQEELEAKIKAEADAKKVAEEAAKSQTDPLAVTVVEAVKKLDWKDETHWNSRGLPDVEAVGKIAGKPVVRAEIETAAPGYNRAAAKALAGK